MWWPSIVAPTWPPTIADIRKAVVTAPMARSAPITQRRQGTVSLLNIASGTRNGRAKANARKMETAEGQLSAQPPPGEGCVHLVQREQHRQGGEHDLRRTADVAEGVDAHHS